MIESVFCSACVCLKGCALCLKSHSAVLFISLGRSAVHISSLTPHVFWLSLLILACWSRWDANAITYLHCSREKKEKIEAIIYYTELSCVIAGLFFETYHGSYFSHELPQQPYFPQERHRIPFNQISCLICFNPYVLNSTSQVIFLTKSLCLWSCLACSIFLEYPPGPIVTILQWFSVRGTCNLGGTAVARLIEQCGVAQLLIRWLHKKQPYFNTVCCEQVCKTGLK